jgi:DNA polymerase
MLEVDDDIESRSEIDLPTYGADIYVNHPSTVPLCLYYVTGDGEPQCWLPGKVEAGIAPDPVPPVFFQMAADPDNAKLSSHGSFDGLFYQSILVPRYGFPSLPAHVFHCTMQLALANGYPAELGLLMEALGLPYTKDPAARRAMLAVCRPIKQRKGKTGPPVYDNDPAKLQLVYARCCTDTLAVRAARQSTKLRQLSDRERQDQLTDITVNQRGVRLDRPFTQAGQDLAIDERNTLNLRVRELTNGEITSVNQRDRFLKVINARGHHMTSMTKRSVAQVLAHKPDDYVRELLELRRAGARAAVDKFKSMLAHAAESDDRMRGTLRMFGCHTGRWSGFKPQLQNLKKNESNLPLSVVDDIRARNRAGLSRYGNLLTLLADTSRAAICAAPGYELKSGDFSAIESVVLAWFAQEQWKLDAYRYFQRTGDTAKEPYRVIARKMLHKEPDAETSSADRQLGKGAELACGFGGAVGAWRRFVPHDPRNDEEIKEIVSQWRQAHPATVRFWRDLMRGLRVAIQVKEPVQITRPPQPPLVAACIDGNLIVTLPSGRSITYPEARLVPGKYEDGAPDIEFMSNTQGQWKPYRGWSGSFVENVIQGAARDLLAAAIARFETRNIPVIFHCHDEVTVEVPVGTLSDAEFLAILLERPEWAVELPLGGKVHSGPHYLAPPDEPAQPLPVEEAAVEQAIDCYLAPEDSPSSVPNSTESSVDDDDQDDAADAPTPASLVDLISLPFAGGDKVCCPFHDDIEPSCKIYPDHYYCFGCEARGSALDWLIRVEGLSAEDAQALLRDGPGSEQSEYEPRPPGAKRSAADKLAFVERLWSSAQPLLGTIGARYLDETRGIDLGKLPADINDTLRFHPHCVFGTHYLPCLLALMRHPLTDAVVGIQRIALELRNGRIEKVDRAMLGQAGVVKLWPASHQLIAGEGLETTLAAATRLTHDGVPLRPAWALLSTGMMRTLPVITGVQRLVLLVDNDSNGSGQAAASFCTNQWSRAGCTVVQLTPQRPNSDFNDLVLEMGT